jgi:hypothetical protein
MIGLESYDVARKEHWRNWWWKRIAERCWPRDWSRCSDGMLRRNCRNKLAVYLVGPEDRDREAAVRNGFSPTNLIAVDCNSDNVFKVRRNGQLALSGRLERILESWPSDWPIDVLSADTCNALASEALELCLKLSFLKSLSKRAVVAVNLQRGKDPASNCIRKDLVTAIEAMLRVTGTTLPFMKSAALHRGVQFVLLHFTNTFFFGTEAEGTNFSGWGKDQLYEFAESHNAMLDAFCEYSAPAFTTTRSSNEESNVRMDSAVFRRVCVSEIAQRTVVSPLGMVQHAPTRRRVTALRAVRTMKCRDV